MCGKEFIMDKLVKVEYDPGGPFNPAALANQSDHRVVCYVNNQENKVCLGLVGHSKCPQPVTDMVTNPENKTFEGRTVDFKGLKPLSAKWWDASLKLATIIMTVVRNSGASVDGRTIRFMGTDLNASVFAVNFSHSYGAPKLYLCDPAWSPTKGAKTAPKKVSNLYG